MKKILILLIFILFLCSCHEIGIRDYKNEVSIDEFILKYTEAYKKSNVESFKDKDYMYYTEYKIETHIPKKNSKNEDVYDIIYENGTFELSQDIDNKVIKNTFKDIYSGDYFDKKEGNYTYYLNSINETIVYDENQNKVIDSVHLFDTMYIWCDLFLLVLKSKDSYNENYKFYIDGNTFTIYYYEKDKEKKLEHAILYQITYKENKVCYYEVEEEVIDKEFKNRTKYMDFLFKNVNFDNKFIV